MEHLTNLAIMKVNLIRWTNCSTASQSILGGNERKSALLPIFLAAAAAAAGLLDVGCSTSSSSPSASRSRAANMLTRLDILSQIFPVIKIARARPAPFLCLSIKTKFLGGIGRWGEGGCQARFSCFMWQPTISLDKAIPRIVRFLGIPWLAWEIGLHVPRQLLLMYEPRAAALAVAAAGVGGVKEEVDYEP